MDLGGAALRRKIVDDSLVSKGKKDLSLFFVGSMDRRVVAGEVSGIGENAIVDVARRGASRFFIVVSSVTAVVVGRTRQEKYNDLRILYWRGNGRGCTVVHSYRPTTTDETDGVVCREGDLFGVYTIHSFSYVWRLVTREDTREKRVI